MKKDLENKFEFKKWCAEKVQKHLMDKEVNELKKAREERKMVKKHEEMRVRR